MNRGALTLALVLTGCASTRPSATSLDALAERSLRHAQTQLRRSVEKHKPADGNPRSTEANGEWRLVKPGDWTSGFFPGLLWYMYDYTKDRYWRDQAQAWTTPMEPVKTIRRTHDLGFMLMSTFGHQYRLTEDPHARDVIIEGSRSLYSRYRPKVGATRSWDHSTDKWRFPVIIDNMMNLEMLFWASEHGGDRSFREAAIQHALTTLREHVRDDSTTFHVVDFDTLTGQATAHHTHQGFAHSSVWARGQAWGIYGFTATYRATKDERFLRAAQGLANWFISHLPEDGVPYWDFMAPNIPNEERDASAGAIAASGLLELSRYSSSPARERYWQTAERILTSLASSYTTEGTNDASILRHSVGSKPGKTEVDAGIIYADYYFVEALLRYLRR